MMRRQVDEAMRDTTSELSRITDLLAVATALPPAVLASIASRFCCFSRAW